MLNTCSTRNSLRSRTSSYTRVSPASFTITVHQLIKWGITLKDLALNQASFKLLKPTFLNINAPYKFLLLSVKGYQATGSTRHDLALLHLERPVDVDEYPHVGLGCLPSPRDFYQTTGAWECFTVGWHGPEV